MAYTTIDDPSAYHQSVAYTGAGNNSSVTFGGNSDLQLDWLWVKRRDSTGNSKVFDTSRGIGSGSEPYLTTISDEQEQTYAYLTSVDSDGFTWDTVDNSVGTSSNTYVAWGWKANGGTTASNTDGSITSTVQANTTAGFSIVSYTGVNTSNGQTSTIGHGLNSAPELIICKRRNGNYGWSVGSTTIGNFTSSNVFELNETGAPSTTWDYEWGANPTGTVFTTGYSNRTNINGGTFIAYCFTPIQGYSKFGSYTGNGNADGPFVYTGFKPAWLLGKRTDGSGNSWFMFDNKRDTENVMDAYLYANENSAETTGTGRVDFLSNGFKWRNTAAAWNGSGNTYIYIAFAEHPFVSSEGVPVTAR